MALKVDNFVKPFRGRGDQWEAFWEKFLVLADIQGWDNEDKRMKHFPLFLDGDAFLVYSKMEEAKRKSQDEVCKKMVESFSVTKPRAYQMFVARCLKADESADAYVARLSSSFNISTTFSTPS